MMYKIYIDFQPVGGEISDTEKAYEAYGHARDLANELHLEAELRDGHSNETLESNWLDRAYWTD